MYLVESLSLGPVHTERLRLRKLGSVSVQLFTSNDMKDHESKVSSVSASCAKGGEFEPHCWQVDLAFHPSMGLYN